MEHYYTSSENITYPKLIITGGEAGHLSKVMRKAEGNDIYVTDGKGNLFACVIESIKRNDIICRITDKQININEPSVKLTAYFSLLKNPARFEFAIEKLTEIGVYEIQPIITEHVISKGKDKSERWQAIALSAMKQSQRCWLPKVNKPVGFKDAIESCKDEIKLIAHEKVDNFEFRISNFEFESKRSAAFFIGPEGGFTDEEIALAEKNGFIIISLGERKLRSETAAVAGAALILSL